MKLALSLLLLLSTVQSLQGRDAAFAINRELGRGINLGNMFEAPTEEAWGNSFRPAFMPLIAELGFSHVRIPIRWETDERSLAESPFTISSAFFERIKAVIDQAVGEGLYVIINMHHHSLLLEDPLGQRARFLSQWEQISAFFADYSDKLLFEIFNEPHGAFTASLWNKYLAESLEIIRRSNPRRFVLIGTAEWGGLGGLSKLELPSDEHLILTVHYYSPFPFTHQGASWVSDPRIANAAGIEWNGTVGEREAVQSDLEPLLAFAKKHHVPVHIGEFGAYSRADLDSRVRWTRYLARTFEEMNFSWAYWEFSAGFGIYDRNANAFIQPLADALLGKEQPPPVD